MKVLRDSVPDPNRSSAARSRTATRLRDGAKNKAINKVPEDFWPFFTSSFREKCSMHLKNNSGRPRQKDF